MNLRCIEAKYPNPWNLSSSTDELYFPFMERGKMLEFFPDVFDEIALYLLDLLISTDRFDILERIEE